jgi:hypothetical protein
MQIIENSIVGTRSAALRLRRCGSELEFVVFPMLHVAMPALLPRRRRELGIALTSSPPPGPRAAS